MTEINSIDIIKDLEDKIKSVRTKSLDLSFNELVDMYKNGELIIDPSYQRLFRWSEENQSRFIESLLLEMPIPPIFVIELEEGTYELIDGLQRISSYLHFRGVLDDYTLIDFIDDENALELVDITENINSESDEYISHDDVTNNPDNSNPESHTSKLLTLTGCDICPGLNGLNYNNLPKTLLIRLKRSFIRVEVIRKESDSRLRYHMFKRLNTGGELLSSQEIRNCTIRLLGSTFNDFIIDLSQNDDFKKCISNISKAKQQAKYDQELVLRYFAFKNNLSGYVHDIDPFLTSYLEDVSANESFDYEAEKNTFQLVFKILALTLGDKSFSPVAKKDAPVEDRSLARKFAIYHFEAIALCITKNIDKLKTLLENQEGLDKLKAALIKAKTDDEFIALTTGGGKNYEGPLKKRLDFIDSQIKEFIKNERL